MGKGQTKRLRQEMPQPPDTRLINKGEMAERREISCEPDFLKTSLVALAQNPYLCTWTDESRCHLYPILQIHIIYK
ncbi:MAG: hypothetical protein D8B56_02125 [Alloprevotella sp.]|nr:MAG: hypothetical protein D8B56_02125 [Alloprevotella sp.]